MTIEIHTDGKPNRPRNDDIAGFEGNTFWLMDGATQLFEPDHGKNASWHVGALDAAFRRALARNPNIDLTVIAKNSIQEVADEFFKASGLDAQAPQELRPFSSLILFRRDQAGLDYVVLTDSTLAVIEDSGEQAVSDHRIEKGEPLAPTNALLKQGFDFDSDEYKREMMGVYTTVFKTLNKSGGWFTVGQDPNVIDEALTGRLETGPDAHILAMSDGFTRAVDTLGLYDSWTALTRALQQKGGKAMLAEIRQAERDDDKGQKHPRSSRHDDATLLWLKP